MATALAATALSAQEASNAVVRNPELPDETCLSTDENALQVSSDLAPIFLAGLGYSGLDADSSNAEARAWFDQGVRQTWAFDEAEAVRAFQQAQRLDPQCAMCFFGEAWARGPTINLTPRTDELEAARRASNRAAALSGSLSKRDRLLLQAIQIRNSGKEGFNNEAYAAFMETAALRMPADDTIAVMAAAARMQLGSRLRPNSLSQLLLERVLHRSPEHTGAIHYYIHLTDWVGRQHLAVPYAERLGRLAPAASHLVHMPSHTFYGVGRYKEAAAVNVAAIAADRDYERRVKPPPSNYRWMLLRHNMQFAINSALMRGDASTALSVSEQYREAFLSGKNVQRASRLLGSATSYANGLHSNADEVLSRPEGPDEDILTRLLRHYERGEAWARKGDVPGLQREVRAIADLQRSPASIGLGKAGSALAEIYQNVLSGRAAMMSGDFKDAAAAYRIAMNRQVAADFGKDPPLFWYPVRRSLAAAMLAQGDYEGARRHAYATLVTWPHDPLALYVLSLADRAAGAERSARENLKRASRLWTGKITAIPLARI